MREQPEAALEAFTAAMQIDPGNREAAEGAREAGVQLARKTERAQAERQRERARRGAPSSPPTPPSEDAP